jgi:hypothetical protein
MCNEFRESDRLRCAGWHHLRMARSPNRQPMSSRRGCTLSPLTPADADATWLAPWVRTDWDYVAVEGVFSLDDDPDIARGPGPDELASLMTVAAGPASSWRVLVAAGEGLVPAPDAGAAAVSASEAAQMLRQDAHRGSRPRLALATSGIGAPVTYRQSAPLNWEQAYAVAVSPPPFSRVVLGATGLRARLDEPSWHARPGRWSTDDFLSSHEGDQTPPAHVERLLATRRAKAAATVAGLAVVASVVMTRTERHLHDSAPAARAPAVGAAAGMLLPDAGTRTSPGGRENASMAFDSLTGDVLLFGGGRLGANATDLLFPRDTWTWNATGWHRLRTADAPPISSRSAFAFDRATGSAVLFGGIGDAGSTWLWNGFSWQRLAPSRHPPAGVFASAAFDSGLHAIVLVTVCCQDSDPDHRTRLQAWKWSAGNWILLAAPNPPLLNRAPLITYDDSNGQLLLLTDGTGPVRNDVDEVTGSSTLWRLNSAGWQVVTATGQSPPFDPIRDRFAFDPASHEAVLFQGGDLPTWTWNGSRWKVQSRSGGPLYSSGLVTDTTSGRALLFGGSVPSQDTEEVWSWEAGRWRRISTTQ